LRINGGTLVDHIITLGPDPTNYNLTGLAPNTEYDVEVESFDNFNNTLGYSAPFSITTPLHSLYWRDYVNPSWVKNADNSLECPSTTFGPYNPKTIFDLTNVGDWVEFKVSAGDTAYVGIRFIDGSSNNAYFYSTGQVNSSNGTIQFLTARAVGDTAKFERISGNQIRYSINGGSPTTISQVFSGPITPTIEATSVGGIIIDSPATNVLP